MLRRVGLLILLAVVVTAAEVSRKDAKAQSKTQSYFPAFEFAFAPLREQQSFAVTRRSG
ncbi:MAG TPA: hypothetical protein VKB02_02770 [Pyrinomonadaceae bacterium]|nr:hypothetical protein [Pyrinomonadaceae bacterium]